MRVTEGSDLLRQGTRGGLIRTLIVGLGPYTAIILLYLLFGVLPDGLAPIYVILVLPLALLQLLGSLCFLGIAGERIASTAQGLNELPEVAWPTMPSYAKKGLRGLALLLIAPLPFVIAVAGLLAAAGVGSVAAVLAPLGIVPDGALGLSGAASVLVGTFGTMAVAAMAYAIVPAMYVHGVIRRSVWSGLNPVAAVRHVMKAPGKYAAAVALGFALSVLLGLVGTATAGLVGLLAAGDRGSVMQGIGIFAGYLYSIAGHVAVLVYAANWLGQYAYAAYEGEIERRVIHEEVDALDADEEDALPTGVVATLEKVRLAGSPLVYEDGEYRLPALQHKSVSKAVLRNLDARGKLEWRYPLHRRNVMSG